MFKVYSTPICPECAKLKQFLNEKGIIFQEIDVLADKDAADFVVENTGMRKVPVFQAGDAFIVGFNRLEIEKTLNC
ncbi:MAG: glutaredoxin domain-containing protein [Nanoarchaeota archaeon]|nr:glutaredoxin domain-containing protein [Nanoarchaeota archaeon]